MDSEPYCNARRSAEGLKVAHQRLTGQHVGWRLEGLCHVALGVVGKYTVILGEPVF